MKETKIVYDARIARELLKRGYVVIDIKPDKYDADRKRSIFVFKNENGLEEVLLGISKRYRTKSK